MKLNFQSTIMNHEATQGLSVECRKILDAWEGGEQEVGPEEFVASELNRKHGIEAKVVVFNSNREFGGHGRTKATMLVGECNSTLVIVYYPFWHDGDFD